MFRPNNTDFFGQRQEAYYQTLAACDKVADSAAFIEFIMSALLDTLMNTHAENVSDQVGDQVSDQVRSLLNVLKSGPLSALECMDALGLSHRPTFRKNYLNPAMEAGFVERTIPDKPNSRLQKYRQTTL